jgi:CRISPR-associated endonuclease/helicase Cas3
LSYPYLLKSHPSKLLVNHLNSVADSSIKMLESSMAFHSFAEKEDPNLLKSACYIIGASHDVGKATQYFQEYLKGERGVQRPLRSHSLLSSLYGYYALSTTSDSILQQQISLLALMIIQHHHSPLEKPSSAVVKICNPETQKIIEKQILAIERQDELDRILSDLRLPKFSDFATDINPLIRQIRFSGGSFRRDKQIFKNPCNSFFILNALYSILIDADRMDAADLKFPKRTTLDSYTVLNYIKDLQNMDRNSRAAEFDVLEARKRLFFSISEKADDVSLDRHLFSLTAPTGFGKTLTGFYFALRLRERLAKNDRYPRIIYVAPFLSILDQNFEVLREALGIEETRSDLLLLHHHLTEMKYHAEQEANENYRPLESEMLIEGWNSEVIVSTFVQLFYTIMGSTPSQLRRFHNLEKSIIILDEVQSIPHEYWPLIRQVMKYLIEKFGIYVILMTATQPLIFERNEIMELVTLPKEDLWKQRVTFQFNTDQPLGMESFLCELGKIVNASPNKSILILMNTIRSSIEVYNNLDPKREKYYLSANVLPIQRGQRIKDIAERLKTNQPIILVSTQVVEAGVDLDFDMVIRDMGPIDSIIQAAGRCNRHGKKNHEESKVLVYVVKNKKDREWGRIIYKNFLIDKSLGAIKESDRTAYDLASSYYSQVKYGASEETSNELIEAMTNLDYEEIRDKFKLIDERATCCVFVELDENASNLWKQYCEIYDSKKESLKRKEAFLRIKPNFYKYVINVTLPPNMILPQQNGFYFVPKSEKAHFYDEYTGFVLECRCDDDNIL